MINTFLRYTDPNLRQHTQLTIGIVGGGATGVELSAELLDASRLLNAYGVTAVDHQTISVHLIEAAPRLLPGLSERISQTVQQELESMGSPYMWARQFKKLRSISWSQATVR